MSFRTIMFLSAAIGHSTSWPREGSEVKSPSPEWYLRSRPQQCPSASGWLPGYSRLLQKTPSHISHRVMVGTPDTSNALARRDDILPPDLLVLFPTGLHEQLGLHQYLLFLHVPDTDGLFASVDVIALDDGVLTRPGRDANLDLRMRCRESSEQI